MSVLFQAGDFNESVNFGNAAGLDAVDPCTFCAWVKPSSLGTNRYLFSKDSDKPFARLTDASGNVRVIWTHSTTNLDASTTDGPLTASAWQFVAVVIDTTNSGNEVAVYVGGLDAVPAASTMSITAPVGTLSSNASRDFIVGNRRQDDRQWQGDMFWTAYWSKAMTAADVRDVWLRLHMHDRSNCLIWAYLGEVDTGTVYDQSGNGNDGTPAISTRSAPAPLWAPMAFDEAVNAPSDATAALELSTTPVSTPVTVEDCQISLDGPQDMATTPVSTPVTVNHCGITATGEVTMETTPVSTPVTVNDCVITVEATPIDFPTTAVNTPVTVMDAAIELVGVSQNWLGEPVNTPVTVNDCTIYTSAEFETDMELRVAGVSVWSPQHAGVQVI